MEPLVDAFLTGGSPSSEQDKLKKLARELKAVACELRASRYPLHGGLDDAKFAPELREKARYLHEQLATLFKWQGKAGAGCCARTLPTRLDWASQEQRQRFELLLAGNLSFTQYQEALRKYDSSQRCNAVWPTNNVAYRCNTCAKNPCMSLCVDCFMQAVDIIAHYVEIMSFMQADHEGHDFSRFFSLAGGACDCGNEDVIEPRGFCKKHGADRHGVEPVPRELTAVAEFLFVKLFVRLCNSLRSWNRRLRSYIDAGHSFDVDKGPRAFISDHVYAGAEPLVKFIQHFLDLLGGPMIDLAAGILLNRELYAELVREDSSDVAENLSRVKPTLREDVDSLPPIRCRTYYLLVNLLREAPRGDSPSPPPTPSHPPAHWPASMQSGALETATPSETERDEEMTMDVQEGQSSAKLPDESEEDYQDASLTCECLLDELMFYLMRLNFPQSLINLLLSLLPNQAYKEWFSCRYFEHYTFIAGAIAQLLVEGNTTSDEWSELTNRIIHVSVQICTSLNVCTMLDERIGVIDRVLDTANRVLYNVMGLVELNHARKHFFARKYIAGTPDSSLPVVDVTENKFVSSSSYWYIMTDAQDLFVHPPISANMWRRGETRNKYILYVSAMQGMNAVWRIVEGNHSEYDTSSIVSRAFTLEWECSTTIMQNTLASTVLKLLGTELVSEVIDGLVNRIKSFFRTIRLDGRTNQYECPPYSVSFHLPLHRHLSYAITQALGVFKALALNIDETILRRLLLHPVRIQAVRAEFQAQMWIRNGYSLTSSIYFYDRPAYTYGFYSCDLALIRYVAARVDKEFFINALSHSFHLPDCFALADEEGMRPSSERVVTQPTWVPFLLDGFLRLLVDVVALKIGTGRSLEAELRAELLALLSFGGQPHSRLRNCLPDRGSHLTTDSNTLFDRVLGEVADFQEPDQGDHIKHGVYRMRERFWEMEFDAVLCRNRCSTAKEFNMFVMMAEEKEKLAHMKSLLPLVVEMESSVHFWLGYRLIDFDTSDVYDQLKPAWALLTEPDFFSTARQILKWVKCMQTKQEHPLIIQQLIYLLTLAVKLVGSDFYSKLVGQDDAMLHEVVEEKRVTILANFTHRCGTTSSLLEVLISLYRKSSDSGSNSSPPPLHELRDKHLRREPAALDRIFGTAIDYVGRLLCFLYHSHPIMREALDVELERLEQGDARKKLERIDLGEGSDRTAVKRKLEAKRKQAAIMQAQKQKQARLMQVMMDREGMDSREMEKLEAKRDPVHLYECPICNDTSANTRNDLVGLMVMVQCDAVVDTATEVSTQSSDLIELGAAWRKAGKDTTHGRGTRLRWNREKDSLLLQAYKEDAISSTRLASGVGVRTCGHFAHLECFKAFVETLDDSELAESLRDERIYQCPTCRQQVNAILPLRPETGQVAMHMSMSESGNAPQKLTRSIEIAREKLRNPSLIDEALPPAYAEYSKQFTDICRKMSVYKDELQTSLTQAELFISLRAVGQSLLLGIVRKSHLGSIPELSNEVGRRTIIARSSPSSVAPSGGQQATTSSSFSSRQPHNRAALLRHLMNSAVSGSTEAEVGLTSRLFDLLSGCYVGEKEGVREIPILLHDTEALLVRLCASILANDRLSEGDKFALSKIIYHFALLHTVCRSVLRCLLGNDRRAALTTIANTNSGDSSSGCVKVLISMLERTANNICASTSGFMSEKQSMEMAFDRGMTKVDFAGETEQAFVDLTHFFLHLMREYGIAYHLRDAHSTVADQENFDGMYRDHQLTVFPAEEGGFAKFVELTTDVADSWLAETPIHNKIAQAVLRMEPVSWKLPRLAPPPATYDNLFSTFFGAACPACRTVPANPLVCCVCGTLVCLDSCCDLRIPSVKYRNEVERHAIECSCGYGCFLSVSSSLVVVVQDRSSAIVWGSVYLDAYGEEDRNLKRGKPLFLSGHRLEKLQQAWRNHNFAQTKTLSSRYSIPIRSLVPFLRESHYYSS